MKNKKLKTLVLAAVGCLTAGSLMAQTVGLGIQSDSFSDAGGTPIPPGSLVGIVVDTSGNGFGMGEWGPSSLVSLTGDELTGAEEDPFSFMMVGLDGGASDDAFVRSSSSVSFGGRDGLIGTLGDIPHADGSGIAGSGMQWGIIWFPELQSGDTASAGDSYGFFTNEDLTIPNPGAQPPYAEYIGNDIKTAEFTIVPEPSTYAAIFGFGVLLFVFLRRRFKK